MQIGARTLNNHEGLKMSNNVVRFNHTETPLYNSLKKISENELYSFHALPLSSSGHSDILKEQKKEYSQLEATITNEAFDNFFFPKGVISESQKLTAKLYRADNSFYITGGTSVANQISITALCEKDDNILVDKNCHQSIHFHCQALGTNVDYLCSDLSAENGQIKAWSVDKISTKALIKQCKSKGYDLIILTAQSYEGLIYDIPGVISHLLKSGVTTRKFFIDEAWGSLNYFCEDTRPYTAMNIDHLIKEYPDLEVVCTHSSHKSLFCLRQASLIHCKGDKNLPHKIEVAKFRIHTTSPNYPILASLDLAQACMHQYGTELASHSRSLATIFRESINRLPQLSSLTTDFEIFRDQKHIVYDPTKIMVNVSTLSDAATIKEELLHKNIFIKRTLNEHILLNFHIGINKEAVNALIDALSYISIEFKKKNSTALNISKKFIIPYPPGVPIIFPGDNIDESVRMKIKHYEDNGLLIIAA